MAPIATEESQPKPAQRIRGARAVVIGLLLLAGLIIFLRSRDSELPGIVLLSPTTTIKHDPFPDRLIPKSWGWAWRLCDATLGKRTPVNFDAQMLQLTDAALPADLGHLPAATLVTNGLSMWSLEDAHLENARTSLQGKDQNKLDPIRARLNTADGIVASMSSGQLVPVAGAMTHVGFTLQVLPRTHKDKTDVTLGVKWIELVDRPSGTDAGATNPSVAIRTNLWQVARVQIPIGNGFLLIQSPSETQPGMAFLLSTGRK